MNDFEEFALFRRETARQRELDENLKSLLLDCQVALDKYKYVYQFDWLGVPIIRHPDDILVFQELVWKVKPDVIIEIGVARGGSVILSSSLLRLIGAEGLTIGIDIDIREHNRRALEDHPMYRSVILIEGGSTSPEVIEKVRSLVMGKSRKIIVLDSNHTHDHVLNELRLYSQFMSEGDYFVLPDTVIEFFPKDYYQDRPWNRGNNPLTALRQFLAEDSRFKADSVYSSKAALSESPQGYLRMTEANFDKTNE